MAKSKIQKQQEASWRAVRGSLVDKFRRGSDEKVAREYGQWFIESREQLWLDYLALPRAWRDNSLDGWSVPDNLQERLDREVVEQQARDLQETTELVVMPRARRRF